jgi:hypothetical protein
MTDTAILAYAKWVGLTLANSLRSSPTTKAEAMVHHNTLWHQWATTCAKNKWDCSDPKVWRACLDTFLTRMVAP